MIRPFAGEFDRIMRVVKVINEFFQLLLSLRPNNKNVINIPPPNMRFDLRILDRLERRLIQNAEVKPHIWWRYIDSLITLYI